MGLLLFSVYGITLSCSGQPIPPLTNQVHLVGIRAIPFKIRIKDWTTNDVGREAAGFRLVKYEPLSEEEEVDGQKRGVDVSRLYKERFIVKIQLDLNKEKAQPTSLRDDPKTPPQKVTSDSLVPIHQRGREATGPNQVPPPDRQCFSHFWIVILVAGFKLRALECKGSHEHQTNML